MKASDLLPGGLRRYLLALAEVGHEANGDLKLAVLPRRRSVFVDVGANRGQFARFMAPLYDRVIVFEPIARFADELRTMLPQNCAVHGCALADVKGSATFYVPDDGDPSATQTATLVAPPRAGAHTETMVEVARLDDFDLGTVSFIKIDIEGGEYACLRGAAATLERCRPLLLVEIEDRHTNGGSGGVFDLLSGLGYDAFILARDGRDRRSSAWARLIRGVGVVSGLTTIPLVPVGSLIDEIRTSAGGLNRAFGGYVNNFLFVPRRGLGAGGRSPPAGARLVEHARHGSPAGPPR